jgi:hypothetical protein
MPLFLPSSPLLLLLLIGKLLLYLPQLHPLLVQRHPLPVSAAPTNSCCSSKQLLFLPWMLLLPTAATPVRGCCCFCQQLLLLSVAASPFHSCCSSRWLLSFNVLHATDPAMLLRLLRLSCCSHGCYFSGSSSPFLPRFTCPPHLLPPPLISWEFSSLLLCTSGGCS